ncbi:hypothetical protein ASC97_01280 [Rhizobium sp. Root1203]|uniref:Arc family DNA-binding protein n=1 Tax=Rhizobium sp. Root1203 TaxID=1736427 RepID=UPI00070BE50B|nr:Arc family DNA-binding protein [Rhizobium sp. Root1203]KQV32258.1 hypothetical protein ASC97_01280 [Rhizobium sp. Root1203]
MSAKSTGRNSDQFNLRLPDGMRDRIADEAGKSGRSMNAEIVHRLANSLDFNRSTLEDQGFDFPEDLNLDLVNTASLNRRSVMEEIIDRLDKSFRSQGTVVDHLIRENRRLNRRLDRWMDLAIHLSPEELRLLEERAELAEQVKKRHIAPERFTRFMQLNPIGDKKRIHLNLTTSPQRYDVLFEHKTSHRDIDEE